MAGLRRGDIHRVRFGRSGGRAQAGERPAVILQTNAMAALSTVNMGASSSTAGTSLPTNVKDVPDNKTSDRQVMSSASMAAKTAFFNASIEARLVKYEMYEGSKRTKFKTVDDSVQ